MAVVKEIIGYLRRPEPYLGLLIFFSFFKILQFINVLYFPTIDRVTYIGTPFDGTIFSTNLDAIIMACLFWITFLLLFQISRKAIFLLLAPILFGVITITSKIDIASLTIVYLPIIIGVIALLEKKSEWSSYGGINQPLLFVSVIFYVGILESLALFGWLLQAFVQAIWMVDLEHRFFYALNLASPVLVIIILSFFAIKILISQIPEKLLDVRNKWMIILRQLTNYDDNEEHQRSFIGKEKTAVLLGLICLFSSAIAFFPHIVNENGNNLNLGTDNIFYVRWMTELYNDSPTFDKLIFHAFVDVNAGDRPITLLMLHLFHTTLGLDLNETVLYFPMLLAIFLTIAVFVFVITGTGNIKLALLASLVSAISYPTVVGIYAGFLANWLGLALGLIALAFLLRVTKQPTLYSYMGFTSFTLLTFFAHSYTGGFLIASILFYILLSAIGYWLRINQKLGREILFVILIVGVILAIDFARMSLTSSLGGIEGLNQLVERTSGLSLFPERWNNLAYTMNIYVGSFLGNPFVLIPSAIWAIFAKFSNNFNRLILSQIAIGLLPVLFGNYVAQTRILYDLLFYISAAIVIYQIYAYRRRYPPSVIIAVSLIIAIANYAIRSLSNLNLIINPI